MKIQKKQNGGGVGRGGRVGGSGMGGQGGCERSIDFFVKIQKNNIFGGFGGFGLGWGARSDVNEKLKFLWKFKKNGGGGSGGWVKGGGSGLGGGGVRVDVNEWTKNWSFWENSQENISGGCREGGGGQVGGRVGWGVRVDVIAMLGVWGDVGYGECEPRIEVIVQCTKGYCTILTKLKKMCGGGGGG